MLQLGLHDRIRIKGTEYTVETVLRFKDKANDPWVEYGLSGNTWISSDENTTAIWTFGKITLEGSDYELEDSGVETVTQAIGQTDCEEGEEAIYEEYVNKNTGERYSKETWDDEIETCLGSVLDNNDIELLQVGDHKESKSKKNVGCWIIAGIAAFCILFSTDNNDNTIGPVLENDDQASLLTSISESKDSKALVYSVSDIDNATEYFANRIIDQCDGSISNVQNSEECGAVAMNTDKDFCLIYTSTDGENLIHYCDREYLYNYLDEPLYNADSITENFYRAYYTNVMYPDDSISYYSSGNIHHYHRSHYGFFFYNTGNRYYTRAQSVRQASVARRNSSGGGHGGGGK